MVELRKSLTISSDVVALALTHKTVSPPTITLKLERPLILNNGYCFVQLEMLIGQICKENLKVLSNILSPAEVVSQKIHL